MKNVLQIFKRITKRFILLFYYIKNFPILYLSLFSIFITFLSIEIYEKLEIYQNSRKFLVFSLLFILILLIFFLTYIGNFSQSSGKQKIGLKHVVQILFLLLILTLRLLFTFINDYKTVENIDSFTGGLEGKDIKILDIDNSRGDMQEVIYEIGGMRGIGYVDWFEKVDIGDLCNTNLELQLPENFQDFDYIRYLKNKNIYLRSSNIQINSCGYKFSFKKLSDIFIWLKRNLRIFRESLSVRIEEGLPEPQASLLIGVLFGSQRAFSDEFEQSLRVSGTTHIIAASGYNITILIMASNKIFGFIKKKYRLILSLILIWLYCILSGLGASILRATVMGSITIFALLSGNVRNVHLLMPMGIFFLLLMSPRILFDIGFQLSILATLGLIYLLPSIEEFIEKTFRAKSVPQFVEDNLLSTISCTLSTLPISISIFQKVSVVSIFANVLVLPLTESTMLYGTISLVGAYLVPKLSNLLFSIPYIQLKIFEEIIKFFGSIDWGYIDVNSLWLGIAIALFIIIFCIYFYPLDKENYYAKRFKDI